jgi:hypothetical protein
MNMESTMQISTHCDARMNQRGIKKDLIDLTLDLGDVDGDRYILTSKIIDLEISDLQRRMHLLDEARRKGGVTVVTVGNTVITTYRTNSFNAKLSK